jgi:hypothetical protein
MNKEVLTSDGIKINGLYRSNAGALIVNNPSEYDKYQKQKEFIRFQSDKIKSLENDVESLKQLVNQLLQQNNG